MKDNNLEKLVDTAMQKIHELADCETVVGKPITADGTTIIPISKVSVGFTSGGSDLPTKGSKDLFGGGTAGGLSLQPIAFITITNGEVKLLQMSVNASKENAFINMIPDVVDKITGFIKKDKDTEKDNL